MKRALKTLLDIVMLVLFLYLMHYHPGMGLRIHAVLGILLFVLFLLHHALNFRWYAALFKGRYSFRRILLTASDVLLLIAMLGMMLSSLMISGLAFPISFLPAASYWRDIHVMSAAWGFLLMAFHLGVHLHGLLSKLEKKLSETLFAYVIYLAELLVLVFGIYGFAQSGLWKDMKMLPQSYTPLADVRFYTEYLGIIGAVCVTVHGLIWIVQKIQEVCHADKKTEKP